MSANETTFLKTRERQHSRVHTVPLNTGSLLHFFLTTKENTVLLTCFLLIPKAKAYGFTNQSSPRIIWNEVTATRST